MLGTSYDVENREDNDVETPRPRTVQHETEILREDNFSLDERKESQARLPTSLSRHQRGRATGKEAGKTRWLRKEKRRSFEDLSVVLLLIENAENIEVL